MEINKGLQVTTTNFWYDLSMGGYLDPYEICENMDDAIKIKDAVELLQDFQHSCEEQIEGFIQ